ncbi:hypothetical protein EB796_002521 [Bugula neritina]|uniref:Uncharacterized protein n=1 Tax=Bugula neritina TaxID=10212 RepID=A0A7J7KLZ4_BUGNE|nr:hypothetical protein EB796_002521 [Bugula neritina]
MVVEPLNTKSVKVRNGQTKSRTRSIHTVSSEKGVPTRARNFFHFRVNDGKQIYLQNETMFQATKLAFHREVDKIGLTYNHEK